MNWKILAPICFVCGLIAGSLVYALMPIAIFVAGVIGGSILGRLIFDIFDHNASTFISYNWWTINGAYVGIGVMLLFGFLFGLIALKLMKSALKILTPFIGGFMISASIAYYVEMGTKKAIFLSFRHFFSTVKNGNSAQIQAQLLSQETLYFICGWFALFIAGVIIQCKFDVHDPTKDMDDFYNGDKRKETAMYSSHV